ncbi:hypothetical protein FRAAL5618 [Frankia alni ACN14a]|uniref:Uncharacterized protein n=1 Tax=Frankia alni (strain DSM 45986 / CECT 9034 / ACN14a) TaxID=326424 RepID=Q0RE60_FRAAA|nr:hypothetical protein FRAAL5618 [Frankia alni ACN14a]
MRPPASAPAGQPRPRRPHDRSHVRPWRAHATRLMHVHLTVLYREPKFVQAHTRAHRRGLRGCSRPAWSARGPSQCGGATGELRG